MSGKRIDNLASHYLGSKNFCEASATERSRFLDEVVRRYVRDANKKYCTPGKYLLLYENHNNGDSNYPYAVGISVALPTSWVLSPYRISGRYRRCDSAGNVTIRCPYTSVFRINFEYSPAGKLEHLAVCAASQDAVKRNALYLTTNVNDIRKGGMDYDLTKDSFFRYCGQVDDTALKSIRAAVLPALSGQSDVTDALRRLRGILGSGLVLEPKTQIINTIKTIE